MNYFFIMPGIIFSDHKTAFVIRLKYNYAANVPVEVLIFSIV